MDEAIKTEIKGYLKIDSTDEDTIIENLYGAALSLAETQTGKKLSNIAVEAADNKDLFMLAIKLLVSHWYENRAMTVTGTIINEIPFTAGMILNHIALCGDFT